MTGEIFVYAGSAIIMVWGIAHIVPVRQVVAGFRALSDDNRRIITMEWTAEGLFLIFTGLLALLVTLTGGLLSPVSILVIRALAIMLVVLAGLTAMTGARTSIIPMKFCPFVKTGCALLFITGTVLS
jgi:hypothetical protein